MENCGEDNAGMDIAGNIGGRLISSGAFYNFQSCCTRNVMSRFVLT